MQLLTIFLFCIADMIFSAPFYLQNLLDKDRFSDYLITDPERFLSSLMLVKSHSRFCGIRSYMVASDEV